MGLKIDPSIFEILAQGLHAKEMGQKFEKVNFTNRTNKSKIRKGLLYIYN
jgi:hypothetical protein